MISWYDVWFISQRISKQNMVLFDVPSKKNQRNKNPKIFLADSNNALPVIVCSWGYTHLSSAWSFSFSRIFICSSMWCRSCSRSPSSDSMQLFSELSTSASFSSCSFTPSSCSVRCFSWDSSWWEMKNRRDTDFAYLKKINSWFVTYTFFKIPYLILHISQVRIFSLKSTLFIVSNILF